MHLHTVFGLGDLDILGIDAGRVVDGEVPVDQTAYRRRVRVVALDLARHRVHGFRDLHVVQVQGGQPDAGVNDHAHQGENAEQADECHAVLVPTHKIL